MKKFLTTALFVLIGLTIFPQTQAYLTISVKAGNIPLEGVTVTYTCNWVSNLGNWSSWNSGLTDVNGELITPTGENLNNVTVEVTNVPWALQQLYGNTFYPAQHTFASLTQHEIIEFNTEQTSPIINILQPNSGNISISSGSSVPFEVDVTVGGGFSIDTVVFYLDGQLMPAIISSGSIYVPQTAWVPSTLDFYQNHTLVVSSTSSNMAVSTEDIIFYLDCSGTNCPNQLPVISWISPVPTTVNQSGGLVPLDIILSIVDFDGSVLSAKINIDGSSNNLLPGSNNTYSYSFTPPAYGDYPLVISAIDNDNDTSFYAETIHISNSVFIPLPQQVIVGYWHSWDNASAPFMYLGEVDSSKFNVVVYSFIETQNGDGFTPQLTINIAAYMNGGLYDPQLLKDDIQSLQSQGIPVLVSIGGQNGHVVLNTIAQKDTFIQGVIDIIEEYGFDGLDIDFEGGSMNFGGGSLTDFSYATISNGNYPKLKNVVDAITEIDAHFGEGFHLTAAPELFYVQVGYGTYTDMAGSFLPVIDNIRNILDYIHVQLYNSGGVVALDNQGYSTGTADFVVAMTDMLLKGFDVATTGIHFNALSQSQVVIGLPACPNAAPAGGYVTPNDLCNALYYLTQGISFGGSYNTQAAVYPNLRGAMTWSVNWDKMSNCGGEWEFSNNIWDFFNPVLTEAETNEILTSDYFVFPNPANDIINIVCPEIKDNTEIRIFDINGKLMMKKKICTSSHKIDLSTFPTGEYFIIIKNSLSKKVFPVIHL